MSIRASRLAVSDYLTLIGAVALVVVLFAMQWYQVPARFRDARLELAQAVSANGWQTFTWVGPLCLIVGLLGITAVWLQLSRRSPALPTVALLVLTPLALLLVVVLVIRVFISLPALQLPGGQGGTLERCAGAYVGSAIAVLVFIGAWRSLRREGVDPRDSATVIEAVPLGPPPGAGRA